LLVVVVHVISPPGYADCCCRLRVWKSKFHPNKLVYPRALADRTNIQ